MSFAKALFVAIDKLFDHGQNKIKMLKFKGVDFKEEKDVPYGSGELQKLDLCYLPKRAGVDKYPVCFLIHGGGFVAGDKYHRRGLSKWIADKGFFVVNINYALSPETKFPAGVVDCVAALNWVGENAQKYDLDLDNMLVTGDSAGGYYSAMLACITDKILYDFSSIHIKDLDSYEYKDVLAPFNFVTKDFPISFITYAEKDMFCKGQGQKLIKKLQGLGVKVYHHHSTKFFDNHCYPLNWSFGAAKENVKMMAVFLRKVAKKEI